MIRLGVIGCGGRVSGICRVICDNSEEAQVVAIADPDADGVRRRLEKVRTPDGGPKIFDDVDRFLEYGDQYDALLIGTRCYLHTPMAVKVAQLRLPVYLEKPVAIDEDQLASLAKAYEGREHTVVVSFPLRSTPLYTDARDIIRSGRLGVINQVQANNNVTYGGVYFGEWYRNYDEVHGLWLQKATHDFDYITDLVDSRPVSVAATMTHLIYGGDMPHELRCSECDKTETCPESPENFKKRGHGGGMGMEDHWCAYSREIKNQDSGSALIQYESGQHASYSQNFVTRQPGKRGAVVTGYMGTLEFDWYRATLSVYDHHSPRVDTIKSKSVGGHMGGDSVLVRNFLDVIHEQAEPITSIADGIRSVAMCLAAKRSCTTNQFESVPTLDEIRK